MEIQGDSSRLGLVRTGHGALDHCGEPELARGLDSCLRAVRDPLGDDGDPVGLEQLANGRRCEPDVVFGGQSGSNGSLSTVAVDRGDLRHGACGRRSHSARSAARPSACAADSGYGKGPGLRLRGQDHRDDRLLRPGSHVGDARGDIGRRHLGGGYEEDDDGVDLIVGDDWRKGVGVRLGSRRAEQIDRVGEDASAGTTEASSSRVLAPRLTSSSPAASQASAQRIPSPPALVTTATRRPLGSGWVERIAATSTQLLDRSRSDHAGLPEERCDRSLRSARAAGVRARRLGARARDLHSSSRERAFAARSCAPTARTFEGCRTTRDTGGRHRWPDPPPRTRGGRSRTRPPCCRSRRTPRIRARGPRSARAAQARGRRSARRRQFVPVGRPSAQTWRSALGPATATPGSSGR